MDRESRTITSEGTAAACQSLHHTQQLFSRLRARMASSEMMDTRTKGIAA